jgi:hypothetical protein
LDVNQGSFFTCVDKKGNRVRPNSPKVVPNMIKKVNPNTGKTTLVQDGFKEYTKPNIYKKNFIGYWPLVHKNMNESNKHNLMVAAFECGNRLDRRDDNIKAAFTYGQRIKYDDLDDENYISNLEVNHNIKKSAKKSRSINTKPSIKSNLGSFRDSFRN